MQEFSYEHFPLRLQQNIDLFGHSLFRMQKLLVQGSPLGWGSPSTLPIQHLRVGVIGTRKPSPEGLHFVSELLQAASGLPIIFVSGGALGIDGQLHAQALKWGLATEAWLVGPLRDPSPRFHSELFAQMQRRENCCLVVPSGLEPDRSGRAPVLYDWLTRNQWLSLGLDLLVVVEAGLRSGTWATVKFALKSNLNIYAVPGSIFNPASEGTNLMITNGYAHPVGSVGFLIHTFIDRLKANPYNEKGL